jgi:hypothetical protein
MVHKEESDLSSTESQPPSTLANYASAFPLGKNPRGLPSVGTAFANASHWAWHALQDHINNITKEVSAPLA